MSSHLNYLIIFFYVTVGFTPAFASNFGLQLKDELYLEKTVQEKKNNETIYSATNKLNFAPYYQTSKVKALVKVRFKAYLKKHESDFKDIDLRRAYLLFYKPHKTLKLGYFRTALPILKTNFLVDSLTEDFIEAAGDILAPSAQLSTSLNHTKFFFYLMDTQKFSYGTTIQVGLQNLNLSVGICSPLVSNGLGSKTLSSVLLKWHKGVFKEKINLIGELAKHEKAGLWWAISNETTIQLGSRFQLVFLWEQMQKPHYKKGHRRTRKKDSLGLGIRFKGRGFSVLFGPREIKKRKAEKKVWGMYFKGAWNLF